MMKAVSATDAMEFTFPALSPAQAVSIAAIFSLPLFLAGGVALNAATAWAFIGNAAALCGFFFCAFFIYRRGRGKLTVTPAEITYRCGGYAIAFSRHAVTKASIISREEFKAMPGAAWPYYLAGTPLVPACEDPGRKICIVGFARRYLVIETSGVTLIFALPEKNAAFSRFAEGFARAAQCRAKP